MIQSIWQILWLLRGEGNGTPLQDSCLENPMDGGAWWAAVYGITQSRTRLKRLSSSSSWLLGFSNSPGLAPFPGDLKWNPNVVCPPKDY